MIKMNVELLNLVLAEYAVLGFFLAYALGKYIAKK